MWSILVICVLLFKDGLGDLVVQLQNGKVQGTTIDTPSGQKFYAWRGIPYGKPPLDKLRYLPPVKAEPWEGILDASKDSPACVSVPRNSGQSEDCLYINVYSPYAVGSNISVNATFPVMFWIYGGSFMHGSAKFSLYDPTPILEEDVIVVTFNYRVGTFGFLSTEDDVILGNAGLKDQLLALKWTRENIAAFGGDPKEITIFGESAGAKSVGFHLVSPLSRDLYKSAIMESGCSIAKCLQPNAKKFAFKLASQINSSITNTSTSEQVKDVLQAADAQLLVNLSSGQSWGPVIEIKSNLSFVSSPLYEAVESGNISKVPIIIGHNSEESLAFISDMTTLVTQATLHDVNPELLVPNIPLKENVTAKDAGKEIHQEFVGKDGQFLENNAAYLKWESDERYARSAHKQAVLHSSFAPAYLYQFSYYGISSHKNLNISGAGRVGHGQELVYLFNISTQLIQTQNDYLTRKRLVKLWTNFAKTSNPTPDDDSTELLQNIKWEPVTKDNIQYLDIGDDLQLEPFQKNISKYDFWDHIWDTYSYRPYNSF